MPLIASCRRHGGSHIMDRIEVETRDGLDPGIRRDDADSLSSHAALTSRRSIKRSLHCSRRAVPRGRFRQCPLFGSTWLDSYISSRGREVPPVNDALLSRFSMSRPASDRPLTGW